MGYCPGYGASDNCDGVLAPLSLITFDDVLSCYYEILLLLSPSLLSIPFTSSITCYCYLYYYYYYFGTFVVIVP